MEIYKLQAFLNNPIDDPKRLGDLRKQFAAIWHANKCVKVNPDSHCSLPICPEWRIIFNHYSSCQSGYECSFHSCGSSRVLIDHYNSCKKSDCRFCAPLRKCSKKTATIVCTTEIQHRSTSGPSTSEFAASMSKGYCSSREWSENACTAKEAYFSTYSDEYIGENNEHRSSSYQFLSSSYIRSPYGKYGKTERIQRELIVMFHVQKCAELEQNDPSKQHRILCSVPHCSKMKRTLIHVAMCQGEGCEFPECEVTRKIIQHWLGCPKRICKICTPVLNSIPALDGESHYEMDEKLLGLLYTSTNGLINIASSDILPYEDCLGAESPQSNKRKFTSPNRVSVTSPGDWDKKRRMD
jgi:hypothetical protein